MDACSTSACRRSVRCARWRLALDPGWVDFVSAGERGEGIAGYTLAVADLQAVLDRADQQGLPRHGHSLTLLGTRIDLQAPA